MWNYHSAVRVTTSSSKQPVDWPTVKRQHYLSKGNVTFASGARLWLQNRHTYKLVLLFSNHLCVLWKTSSSRKNNKLPHIVMISVHRRCTCKLGWQQVALCLCCHQRLCYQKQLCVIFTFWVPMFLHAKAVLRACPSVVWLMPAEIQDPCTERRAAACIIFIIRIDWHCLNWFQSIKLTFNWHQS